MDAGKLRHRVMLQQVTRTPDDSGGFTESWATIATVWAYVRAQSSYERVDRDAVAAQQRWDATIRYTAVSVADRLSWDGRTLEIEAVVPDAMEQYLTLRCREDRVA